MALKDRGLLKFPSRVLAATGLAVEKLAGVYTFALDFLSFDTATAIADLDLAQVLIFTDNGDDTANYTRMALSDFLVAVGVSGPPQIITAAGPATVDVNASLVIVNQTVGAAITLNMPLSSAKVGKVKIVDWKGDSDVNPITVESTELFNGAATSWTISGAGASAVFDPYPGVGYAV